MTTTHVRSVAARQVRQYFLVAAGLFIAAATNAQAGNLVFTLDATQSYIQLAIPNFVYEGNAIDIRGQNRTNGAGLATAGWSTTTGNQAFVSGTIATNITGNFSGGIVNSVQFLAGSNNLVALTSGNYRPNYAAYNSLTSSFNNNAAATANYAATPHVALGNAGLTSFSNTVFDIGTSSSLPVAANQFAVNTNGTPVNTGILSTNFAVEGLVLFLAGQVLPNATTVLTGGVGGNISTELGQFTFTSPTNLQVRIPVLVPFSVDLGGGVFLNGTDAGYFVANAPVPEPSTIALAGTGLAVLAAFARRRRLNARVAGETAEA